MICHGRPCERLISGSSFGYAATVSGRTFHPVSQASGFRHRSLLSIRLRSVLAAAAPNAASIADGAAAAPNAAGP